MKTRRLLLAAAMLAANGPLTGGEAPGRFEVKLPAELRILQALNRLTFGARPGDVDAVRKMGVEKWIELQLHPDRIARKSRPGSQDEAARELRMDRRKY